MVEVETTSLACSGSQDVPRSLTRHSSSAPVAPGMDIQGCRQGNSKRPSRSPTIPRIKTAEAAKASISQTCHASTFSLTCIPRTPCHLLLSLPEFACEVTLKETLTFRGTPEFLRPGTGIQSLTCFGRIETSRAEFRSDALRTETVIAWDRQFGVEG